MEEAIFFPFNEIQHKFNPPLKLAVMASGNGTNFESLVLASKLNLIDITIEILIVNNLTCGAVQIAKKYNIPYLFLQQVNYPSREDFDKALIKKFQSLQIEGIIMAGWMRIITKELINAFPGRILNIHPSLLPSFKGMNAITQAINHSVKISGCTVHLVEEEVDSGEILAQAAVPVYLDDDDNSLHKRIQKMEHKILPIGILVAGLRWRGVNNHG